MTFDTRCYLLLKQIPQDKVTTYKEIAQALGTKAYRAVGNAMNKNPYPKENYPCHRVIKSDGTVGGYAFGTEAKIARLIMEGFNIKEGRVVDLDRVLMKASDFDLTELKS